MNGFEKEYFPVYILVLYVPLLIIVYSFADKAGINESSGYNLVVESILTLLVTILTIALPLLWSRRRREEEDEKLRNKEEERRKGVYLLLGRYIGEELSNNKLRIVNIIKSNETTFDDLEKSNHNDKTKTMIKISIWKIAAEEMLYSLEDISHKSLIGSRAILMIADEKMLEEVKVAYTYMTDLKQRLRRIRSFFQMLQSPSADISQDVIDRVLITKVPASIETVEVDIRRFLNQADKAIEAIKFVLKPYGKEIRVVET